MVYLKLLTVISFISIIISIPMKLHLHSLDTGARCLDGTPSALYYAEGQQNDKTVIYIQGGGMCVGQTLSQALEDCYQRSSTIYGSSKNYSKSIQSNTTPLLSSDPTINPLYYKWNKVYIPYCDGSLHQGSAFSPVDYKGLKMYFRGSNNTINHFQFINSVFNLFSSKDVVLTGSSAGGIATLFWGNYLYNKLQNKKLLLISDSGIFHANLDLSVKQQDQKNSNLRKQHSMKKFLFNSFNQKNKEGKDLPGILSVTNSQIGMPLDECWKQNPDQVFCFYTQNLAKYIIAPIFVIQSLYDEYSLKDFGVKCISDHNYSKGPSHLTNCTQQQFITIEKYRQKHLKSLQYYSSFSKNGVWGIACFIHTFLIYPNIIKNENWRTPILNPSQKGQTISQALTNFVNGVKNQKLIDGVSYPYNTPCNGLSNSNYLMQEKILVEQ